MSFDTEKLIYQVQIRRYLWDPGFEGYKDKEMRDNSWYEIASAIVCDYDTLNNEKKEKSVEKLQRRWKSARDAYVRDRTAQKKIKLGLKVNLKKQYIYNHLLHFLDLVEEKNNSNNETAESDNEDIDIKTEEQTIIKLEETPIVRREIIRHAITEVAPGPEKKTRKRRRTTQQIQQNTQPTLERELITYLHQSKDEIDEDKAFFTSLLPTLREFDNDQKLIFRSEVLRLLMSLKSTTSHLTDISDHPSVNLTITPDIAPDDYS